MAARKRFPFGTRIGRRLLLIAAGCFAAFLLFNYVLMPAYVNRAEKLLVPRVTGLPLEEARRILDSTGLETVEAGTRPDPRAPIGTVVAQNPTHDAMVKSGRRVYLTVSGGEVLVPTPRLRGLSLRDSRFTLERSGLVLGQVAYDTSGVFPEHTVMAQVVPPGSKVARGTAVGVTVSRGKFRADILVPDLTGRTLGEAERELTAGGFVLGQVTYQPGFDLLPNTVVDQYPRGGSVAPAGSAVDLFVVKGGKPKEEIEPP